MRNPYFRVPLAAAAVAASAVSGLVITGPAGATQPGQDGMLAMSNQYGQGTLLVNPDGSGQHQYTPPSGNAVFVAQVAWSPDGSRLAIIDRSGGGLGSGLVITDPDGSHPVYLGAHSPMASSMAWSTDGKSIVYASSAGDDHLYSIPVDGSAEATPIVTAGATDCVSNPHIVGNLISYTVELQANPNVSCQGTDSVWIHDSKANTDKKVLDNAHGADISPDGARLAFLRPDATYSDQVYTAKIDGSAVTAVTTSGRHGSTVWSPSGTRLAWSGQDAAGNGSGTWIEQLSNGNVTNISAGGGDLAWQPLGTQPPPVGYPGGAPGTAVVIRGASLVVVTPGAPDRTIATDARDVGTAWSPNGNRVAYGGSSGLMTVQGDGSSPVALTGQTFLTQGLTAVDPAFSSDGGYVFFTAYRPGEGYIAAVTSDGTMSKVNPARLTSPAMNQYDAHPNAGIDGSLLFDRSDWSVQPGSVDVFRLVGTNAPAKLIANAAQPAYSPDAKQVAFVRKDGKGVDQLFRVASDGVSGLTQLTHGNLSVSRPSWSPDGSQIVFTLGGTATDPVSVPPQAASVRAADGTPTGSVGAARDASWQPALGRTSVVREWGSDRIGTAIAASRYNFAGPGNTSDPRSQAGAVVLSRSDQYADALAGSSLAVRVNAPLLITDPAALDPAVRTEIGRVLAPGGTVYVLGGTAALSPAVSNTLSGLGYHVIRLAGPDRFGTALTIDARIDPNPKTVMIATGTNFKDALAAGATGEPLVLTDGPDMPAVSAAYLNRLDPNATLLVTVGGPGDKALVSGFQAGKMPAWPQQVRRVPLVGATAPDSAVLVAESFTFANAEAAVATTGGWADALSGGAMIGHLGGPLLLTDPTGLYGPVAQYLAGQNASLWTVDMLGGTAALPAPLVGQIGALIGAGPAGYHSFPANAAAGARVDLPSLKTAGPVAASVVARTAHQSPVAPKPLTR